MAAIDARRARALVGTRFRAQGRDPATGLDCIGLVLKACALPETLARHDYRLRGDHRDELRRRLELAFRLISAREAKCGDLMLLSVTSDQLHLAILTDNAFVHADAGLRRVVETPGGPPWPLIATYRRRLRPKAGN